MNFEDEQAKQRGRYRAAYALGQGLGASALGAGSEREPQMHAIALIALSPGARWPWMNGAAEFLEEVARDLRRIAEDTPR